MGSRKAIADTFRYRASKGIEWVDARQQGSHYLCRFIEEVADSTYAQNIRLIIHNGTSTDTKLNMGKDKYGLIKQFASVRCGIVMFTGKPEKRIEGNRSYFKACCSNVGSGYFLR